MADTLVAPGPSSSAPSAGSAETVASPSSLSFDGLDTSAAPTGEPEAPDSEGVDFEGLNSPGDPGAEEPTGQEEQETDAQAQSGSQEQVVPGDQQPAQKEDLPEGVTKGLRTNGKEAYFLDPPRWEKFHGAWKTLRESSELVGQPLTPEVVGGLHQAYLNQERLFGNLNSADPTKQADVLNFILDEGLRAQRDGEVGSDPIIPLTTTFYETVQAKHPDAYAQLRLRAAKDLVQEMYGEAQRTKSRDLYFSAGHFAKTLGLPYKEGKEMTAWMNAPKSSTEQQVLMDRVRTLESQIQSQHVQSAEAQFSQWHSGTRDATTQAVYSQAVLPSVLEASKMGIWKDDPKAFQDQVVVPLNKAVHSAISADARFGKLVDILAGNAKTATSEQRRAELRAEISQMYVNRASLAAEALAPGILREAATRMTSSSAASHARRQAGIQKAPQGGVPVKRSLVPQNGTTGEYSIATPENLMKDLQGLFPR